MKQQRIQFFDTTLRDGEQSPGCSMNKAEKLCMARQLETLGVDVLEAGFAIASQGDFDAVQLISREVRGLQVASLARATREDIEAAARALEPAASSRIHIFLASSDIHLQYKLKITREQALERAAFSISLAQKYFGDIEFSPEDSTRTDPEFLCQIVSVAIGAGATIINLPDTVGYTVPQEYAALFHLVQERVPGIEKVTLSCHCHNDLGLAVANSLAAIGAGAMQVECTINGIGERAGNAALEEIAVAMHVRQDKLPFTHGLRLDQLYPTSQLLSQTISYGPSPNKAVVGNNAFAHEAGIHQHGVLSNPLCYEIMTPALVGVPSNRMVLGKHSGRHALGHRLNELGYPLDRNELDATYQRFIHLADRKQALYDQDLIALLSASTRQLPGEGTYVTAP